MCVVGRGPFSEVPEGLARVIRVVDGKEMEGTGYSYNSPSRETTGLPWALAARGHEPQWLAVARPLPSTQQVAGQAGFQQLRER